MWLGSAIRSSRIGDQAPSASLHEGAWLRQTGAARAGLTAPLDVGVEPRALPIQLAVGMHEADVRVQRAEAREAQRAERALRGVPSAPAALLADTVVIDQPTLGLAAAEGAGTRTLARRAALHRDQEQGAR